MYKSDTKKIVRTIIIAVIAVILVSVGIVVLIQVLKNNNKGSSTTTSVVEPGEEELGTPEKISLQLAVDQWVDTQANSDNSGIYIYDLDNKAIVGRHNESKTFHMEALMNMFAAYEGYYRLDHGTWDEEFVYADTNLTHAQCLDRMIRWSYFPCLMDVTNEIGWDNLQTIFKDRGYDNTNIPALTTTPNDLAKLYRLFWNHKNLKEKSWTSLKTSMFEQANDEYSDFNHRQSLPAGFNTAKVYNKSGWLANADGSWKYYADAAFVTFEETTNKDGVRKPARNYVVVIMTTDTDYREIVKFGRKIESAVKSADQY